MKRMVIRTEVKEATRAEITFANGYTRTIVSQFEDTQGGREYNGGSWGPFVYFREKVEESIKNAQRSWGLPSAEVRYTRITKTVETVLETSINEKHYSTRAVSNG